MDQEELAERQRKRVKHRYYQTIHSLSRSRELVQQLTAQHRRLLQHQHEATAEQSDARQHALRQYTGATALADQLREEKQRLLELMEEREKMQDRLVMLLDESCRYKVTDRPEDLSIPAITLRSLTAVDCEEITRSTCTEIQRFLENESLVSTNASVLGWRDKREMKGCVIRMALGKSLEGLNPFDLALKTWQLFQTPFAFADLFSPSIGATIQCLQVVNDSNVVLLNNFASVDGNGSFRALFLATFVKVDGGFAVLHQSIDRAEFEVKTSVECEDQWLEIHMSFIFRVDEAEENKAHAHIGGKVTGINEETMKAWMLELLLLCLRWENRVVGPRTLVWSEGTHSVQTNRLGSSRELVQKLTDQHLRLLEHHTASTQHSKDNELALRRYTEATALTNQLREEKQRLMELVEEREKLYDRLTTLLDENARELLCRRHHLKANTVITVIPSITFRPLTPADCEEITSAAFAEIQRFLDKESHVTTNISVLGWRDKREMTGRVIRMSLEKVLDGFTAFDLALRTWRMLQGEFDNAKLFSPSIGATVRCLQVVNDTNVVLLNDFALVGQNDSIRVIYLASLIKIDGGYAVLFESFDRAKLHVETSFESGDEWLDIHKSHLFRATESDESKVPSYLSGKLCGASPQAMTAWMMELLLLSLRWVGDPGRWSESSRLELG